jgi:coenzyme Q-binding protein COQ10
MTTYRESRSIAYPLELLFELVADVESYPEFLPFWREARIVRRDQDVYYTVQSIGFGPVSDRFYTKTRLESPRHIVVTPHQAEWLFDQFLIEWQFEKLAATSSKVDLTFNVEPRSRLLHRLVDKLTREAARGMLPAFERRARSRSHFSGESSYP